uniref:Uncharacterized protein n=1 Tax=Anguilla anguilla TaxID=7936 RepID=A0A0E9VJ22_ANGAN
MVFVPCDGLANCPGCTPANCPMHAGIGSNTSHNPYQEEVGIGNGWMYMYAIITVCTAVPR